MAIFKNTTETIEIEGLDENCDIKVGTLTLAKLSLVRRIIRKIRWRLGMDKWPVIKSMRFVEGKRDDRRRT